MTVDLLTNKGLSQVPNTHARMTFERELQAIAAVRDFMELGASSKPSDIGAAAFDWVLEQAKP